MTEELNIFNAIWDDGEWVGWDEINRQIQHKEWRARYPNARLKLVPYFEELLQLATRYFFDTDNHLQVYGDIGELYGAITHGIDLHRNYAMGSDGRLGDDFVEIKTITPFKKNDAVVVRLDRHFSKLFVVKINEEFEISGKLVDRKTLVNGIPKGTKRLKICWNDLSDHRYT